MGFLLRKFRYFWAHVVTGYGEISLHTEGGDCIIVSVKIWGRSVDVIREYGKVDGTISHCVTSLGIREEWGRAKGQVKGVCIEPTESTTE